VRCQAIENKNAISADASLQTTVTIYTKTYTLRLFTTLCSKATRKYEFLHAAKKLYRYITERWFYLGDARARNNTRRGGT
jgi:hypothetical protein